MSTDRNPHTDPEKLDAFKKACGAEKQGLYDAFLSVFDDVGAGRFITLSYDETHPQLSMASFATFIDQLTPAKLKLLGADIKYGDIVAMVKFSSGDAAANYVNSVGVEHAVSRLKALTGGILGFQIGLAAQNSTPFEKI